MARLIASALLLIVLPAMMASPPFPTPDDPPPNDLTPNDPTPDSIKTRDIGGPDGYLGKGYNSGGSFDGQNAVKGRNPFMGKKPVRAKRVPFQCDKYPNYKFGCEAYYGPYEQDLAFDKTYRLAGLSYDGVTCHKHEEKDKDNYYYMTRGVCPGWWFAEIQCEEGDKVEYMPVYAKVLIEGELRGERKKRLQREKEEREKKKSQN